MAAASGTHRPVFGYRTGQGGAAGQVMAIVAPAVVHRYGLRPEAVLGAVTGEPPRVAPETFRQNRAFVDFLAEVIGSHLGEVASARREAARQGNGYLYVVDGRTPDPGGTVPPQDIIGAVAVQNGVPTAGSYRHNPHHRLLTAHGFFVLAPELEVVLQRAVRALYPPAEGDAGRRTSHMGGE